MMHISLGTYYVATEIPNFKDLREVSMFTGAGLYGLIGKYIKVLT